MTFKQSQGYQTYNEHVDPRQGYKQAKFERSHFKSVQEKGNVILFFLNKEIYQLSPLNMCETQK